jgi:general secretion pathway protein J
MNAAARGFTLVEMLVALLAFSLLAAASMSILNFSLRNKAVFDESLDTLQQVQVARVIMKADFSQLAPRMVRDSFGGQPHSSFANRADSADKGLILSFVRRGWISPAGDEGRSSLQYVEYVVSGDALLRRSRPYLDPTPDTPEITTTLIENVGEVSVSFLSAGKWIPEWRPVARNSEFPDAVAITMDVAGLGEMRQAFLTPAR